MKNIKQENSKLLISKINKENIVLLEKQALAFKDLLDEFEMMFAIVKSELSKTCSLSTMRYMLMIDVFLNELKNVFYNYSEDIEEETDNDN